MPDTESQRRLYLVRHGEAKPKEEDPERGLTDVGRKDVTRMAVWATASGIEVDEIRHSGKLRAQQTAEIFAEHLGTQAEAVDGLAPNDDVTEIAKSIESEQGDVMLVGHLPFLERLVALLITGKAENKMLTLEASALVVLTQSNGDWQATCLMQPRLLPGA